MPWGRGWPGAGGWWRLICAAAANRPGRSDSLSYVPLTYLVDLRLLIETAGIGRFVVLGSSLGGALAMQLTTAHRDAMAGAILNDIGPTIELGGLERLRSNVGRQANWPTWVHAARDLGQRHQALYPAWGLAEWLGFAKNLCRVGPSGRIIFDYDPRIAEPFRLPNGDAGVDLWQAFGALAGLPVLSLRAEYSDVLTRATQARMQAALPEMTMVEVPGVGHAPTLAEPVAIAAIEQFLEKLSGRE